MWANDFVEHRTHGGREFRMLGVVDEFTREALALLVKRRLNSLDMREVAAEPMLARETPSHIRSGDGPEFAALAMREWLANPGVDTAFIEPGGPWGNDDVESFTSKLRDEPPDGEILHSPKEAEIFIEAWRRRYDPVRPHSALGRLPPAREVGLMPPTVRPHTGPSIAVETSATVHQRSSWIRSRGPANWRPSCGIPDARTPSRPPSG